MKTDCSSIGFLGKEQLNSILLRDKETVVETVGLGLFKTRARSFMESGEQVLENLFQGRGWCWSRLATFRNLNQSWSPIRKSKKLKHVFSKSKPQNNSAFSWDQSSQPPIK